MEVGLTFVMLSSAVRDHLQREVTERGEEWGMRGTKRSVLLSVCVFARTSVHTHANDLWES